MSSLLERAELANYLYKELFDKIHASTNRTLYYPAPSDRTTLTGLTLYFSNKQELTDFCSRLENHYRACDSAQLKPLLVYDIDRDLALAVKEAGFSIHNGEESTPIPKSTFLAINGARHTAAPDGSHILDLTLKLFPKGA